MPRVLSKAPICLFLLESSYLSKSTRVIFPIPVLANISAIQLPPPPTPNIIVLALCSLSCSLIVYVYILRSNVLIPPL